MAPNGTRGNGVNFVSKGQQGGTFFLNAVVPMADYADIEDALVIFIADLLYPNGINAPSIVGQTCRIFRGWPLPVTLNTDLASGVVNITVFPTKNPSRILPPLPITYTSEVVPSSLSTAILKDTVTFIGAPAVGQCAGVMVDGAPYVYRPRAGDSPAAVAAAFAALVSLDRIARLSGAELTVPGASVVLARVVSDKISLIEVRRQEREASITCWCATPALRDAAAEAIDVALAAFKFLPLPEGSSFRARYHDTVICDQSQNASLYRRDLIYIVEYPTVIQRSEPEMLFGDLQIGMVRKTI